MDERLERKAEGEFLIVVADQSRDKTRQLERGRKQRSRVWYNDSAQFLSFCLLGMLFLFLLVLVLMLTRAITETEDHFTALSQSINQSVQSSQTSLEST